MKLLLFDKLQRLKLGWMLVSFLSFGIGLSLPDWPRELRIESFHFSFIFVLFLLGTWPLELGGGYDRVILSLPLTARRLGRFLWMISVGLQTLAFAFFSGLGLLLRLLHSNFGGELFLRWLQSVLIVGLIIGSLFWFFSGAPAPKITGSKRSRAMQLGYQVAMLASVVGFIYWLNSASLDQETKYMILCVPCLVCTVLGWYRAEGLVVDYSEYRSTACINKALPGSYAVGSGGGGILYLLITSYIRQLAGLAAIILGIGCLGGFIFHQKSPPPLPIIAMMLPFFFCLFSLQEQTRLVSQLRYLRTLPLRPRQIALMMLAVTLLPLVVCSGISMLLTPMDPDLPSGMKLFKGLLAGIGPACVLIAVSPWHSESSVERIVITITCLCLSAIVPLIQLCSSGPGFPMVFILGYALAVVILTVFIIVRLLEKNDLTYRPRPELMQNNMRA